MLSADGDHPMASPDRQPASTLRRRGLAPGGNLFEDPD